MRRFVSSGLLFVALLVPAFAAADDKGVAVMNFDGPKAHANKVRRSVVQSVNAQSGFKMLTAVQATRAKNSLGVSFDSADGYAAVAREIQATAFVEGTVSKAGRNWAAKIVVREGRSGEIIGDHTFTAAKPPALAAAVKNGFWKELGNAIASAQSPEPPAPPPPPPPSSSPTVEQSPYDSEAPPGMATGGSASASVSGSDLGRSGDDDDRNRIIQLAVGIRGFSRKFQWNDNLVGPSLASYSLGFGPLVGAHGVFYPAAIFTNGIASHFGLSVRYERSLGIESELRGGMGATGTQKYSTYLQRFEGGLRVHATPGIFDLHGEIGYGAHQFVLDEAATLNLPNVDYRYLRFNGGISVSMGSKLRLDLEMAYLLLTSLGELGSDAWFPKTTGGAVDAELGLAYILGAGFELRGVVGFRRFYFSHHPEPRDPSPGGYVYPVAGGSIDQYINGGIELGFRY